MVFRSKLEKLFVCSNNLLIRKFYSSRMSERVRRSYDEFTTRVCEISFGKRFARQKRAIVHALCPNPRVIPRPTKRSRRTTQPPCPRNPPLKSRDSFTQRGAHCSITNFRPRPCTLLYTLDRGSRACTHAHTGRQIMRPPTNQSIRRHLFDCSLTSA